MNRIGLKAALLVIVASIASAVARDGDAGVRNCTRCRGASGQGYTVAPRLAGQRPASIESQVRSFRDHTRNIPFSKQYMWGAVAAIDPRGADFATIRPKLANGGNSVQANAEDEAAAPVSVQELKAKTDYCKTCHGIEGQGFRGSVPMPRLAGQQPEYLANQLQAFIERRRNNPVMFNVVRVLTTSMLNALAGDFKDLNPKPLGGAPTELVPEGKKIYEEGLPGQNVPACASCHGTEAKGDGQFPRLAGQLYDYVTRNLTNWESERDQGKANLDTSAIMQAIARDLSEAQIKAVAAYVSQLE
jgi:cytochrome c553